ncbi:MAG: hypothetical protein OXC14_14615, partial [Rhodospirillaceae bacterium]|nr:hypothetical protein [Rhodospirillaceae bacterium]
IVRCLRRYLRDGWRVQRNAKGPLLSGVRQITGVPAGQAGSFSFRDDLPRRLAIDAAGDLVRGCFMPSDAALRRLLTNAGSKKASWSSKNDLPAQ